MIHGFARFLRPPLLLLTLATPRAALSDDGHVVQGGDRFKPNPEVVSGLILQNPIYQCADTVVVKGFEPHAAIEVFVAGNPNPISTDPNGIDPSGQPVKVSMPFTAGQKVTARQIVSGVKGGPSNQVTVTTFQQDYPAGLPAPVIDPALCLNCGAAVGVGGVVPGATYTVFAETPMGGGYGPKMKVGGNQDFPYTYVSPKFKTKQRITASQSLCSDVSPASPPQIVQADPAHIPGPVVNPVYPGTDRVVVEGPAGAGVLDGATLSVFADYGAPPSHQVGGQPSPGGYQQVLINPVAPSSGSHTFSAIQALCAHGTRGPTTTEQLCNALPAAQIRPPLPGDTVVYVTEFVPGSTIRVYVTSGGSTKQIGAGGGSVVGLTQAVTTGDTITVVQSLDGCQAQLVYEVTVGCNAVDPNVCSSDWPTFRHSGWRDGQQTIASALSDPEKVRNLKVGWTFTPPAADGPIAFKASPIVYKGSVFIGNGNGRFYALNAATGAMLWEYPKPPAAALTSQFAPIGGNPSAYGVASSATIAFLDQKRAAVVFAAPDQSLTPNLGSGRLFALDPTSGTPIWKSPAIAILNGLTLGSFNQKHENLGYSAPLALGNLIYVGIADHGDNPIQAGRLVAVDVNSGNIDGGFSFSSTGSLGGDIWSSPSGGLDKDQVTVTTGNSSITGMPEPSPDHALSMLGLNATTGAINWDLRTVPFDDDNDPDWAAGATLIDASCGHFAASTEKDGWSYAAQSSASGGGMPPVAWQFPPTGIPFPPGDMRHDDTRYIKSGAGWNDTYITMDGGYDVETSLFGFGFTQLHALDACAPSAQPVRWIAAIPDTTAYTVAGVPPQNLEYQLGPPTVTGGIIFVGTATGHLIVLADPSVYASGQVVCSNPEVSVADCAMAGYAIVQQPIQLDDVALGDGAIQTEPALAGGQVFVATDGGQVVMLHP